MKKIARIFLIIMAALMITSTVSVTAFAEANIEQLQKSVIYVETVFEYTAANWPFSGTKTVSGTAWAIGESGKPVQYLATAAHVVHNVSGNYAILVDTETMEVLDMIKVNDGTALTSVDDTLPTIEVNGYECYLIVDYVDVISPVIKAYFSYANNSYRTLSIVDVDDGNDVAICEISGEPTDKLSPSKLMFREDVEKGSKIISIGYPGISTLADKELTLEQKDSTVVRGDVKRETKKSNNSDPNKTTYVLELSGELSQGNSGGPIFDAETGAVIGICSFMYVDAQYAVKTNYAVCVDYLKPMLEAHNVPYEVYNAFPVTLIIIIAAAVVVIAAIIIIVLVATKKNSAPAVVETNPAPAPAPAPAPTAAVKKYYLIGVSGQFAGQKFSITDRAVIGRDPAKCNVAFPAEQPGISSVHCEVIISGGSLMLKDCGSSYGTFLENGAKLQPQQSVTLGNNARFWLANKENTFEVRF